MSATLLDYLAPLGVKHVIVSDYETFYTTDYSLKKMLPLEYVLDRRFELQLLGLKFDDNETVAFKPDKLNMVHKAMPWSESAVICHNPAFDGTILKHRFGISPKLWIDTASMANNLVRPFTGSSSLREVAKYYGLPDKGDALALTKGQHAEYFSEQVWKYLIEYCKHDVDLALALAERMIPGFPLEELRLIDLTVRLQTEPKLRLNAAPLEDHIADVAEQQRRLADEAGLTPQVLRSNPKFAEVLRSFGVEPPMKPSPADPDKLTYAFAKQDIEFMELMDHDDPRVVAVMQARLSNKSSIETTRARRFQDLAERGGGMFPVPLLYCGADTTRHSGTGGLNTQNLQHGSKIRMCIEAPPGHKVVVADAKQIEARTASTAMGQWDKVEQFRNGLDVYSVTATGLFGYEVSDCDETYIERQVGKITDLQLQYGAGHVSLHRFLHNKGIRKSLAEAQFYVRRWRAQNSQIYSNGMKLFDDFVVVATGGRICERVHSSGMFAYGLETPGVAYIELANGLRIRYPAIQRKDGQWGYIQKKGPQASRQVFKEFRPTTIINNAIQGTARTITMQHALKLYEYNLRFAMQVHDELVFVVPFQQVENVKKAIRHVMRRAPHVYAQQIPLDVSINVGDNYYEAKG